MNFSLSKEENHRIDLGIDSIILKIRRKKRVFYGGKSSVEPETSIIEDFYRS